MRAKREKSNDRVGRQCKGNEGLATGGTRQWNNRSLILNVNAGRMLLQPPFNRSARSDNRLVRKFLSDALDKFV
jgi:hypothetical protein